ncbi:MAG: def [Gammaproteobacteria bacterium]|jgi:peptide deformylase|nr:def [Gammaproteobacteria bacterium]
MALIPIVYYSYHPALHKIAEPVTEFDSALAQLIQDMYETMYHAEGCGLAAPQIGLDKRIAVIDISEEKNKPFCIINPEIIEKSGSEMMSAGCLSVPGTYTTTPRATYVKVRAQNETGHFFEIEGSGLLGHCLQHEIDHLLGKLNIDYLSPLKKKMALKKMKKSLKRNKNST